VENLNGHLNGLVSMLSLLALLQTVVRLGEFLADGNRFRPVVVEVSVRIEGQRIRLGLVVASLGPFGVLGCSFPHFPVFFHEIQPVLLTRGVRTLTIVADVLVRCLATTSGHQMVSVTDLDFADCRL